ncbi:MAG: urease accessory UreF family protein [Pseudomonadota bacterium]
MASTLDPLTLLSVTQLADSAFPSGGFAFSQGLESLVAEKRITGEADLRALLEQQLHDRWLVFDRYFVTAAHRDFQSPDRLAAHDQEVECMTPAEGLREGSKRNGMALLTSHEKIGTAQAAQYRHMVMDSQALGHLPVVQGLVLHARDLDLDASLAVAVHGFLAGQVSAAVRLSVIGTLAAQRILGSLHKDLASALARPLPEDAPWSFTPLVEIAAMRHETRSLRLFTN